MFLSYMHSFRGVTIALIVVGHVVFSLDWSAWGPTYVVIDLIVTNCTIMFVFIGGFLFEHLSAQYRYRDYLWRKFQVVVAPYLICSIPAIAYSGFINPNFGNFPFLAEYGPVQRIAWFYLTGGAHLNLPLWFIPMIVLFYLAAPLFIQFVVRPKLYWLLTVLIPLSALAHRPATLEFYPGHTLQLAVYFAPIYILGMWASANRQRAESFLRRRLGWIAIAYVAYLGVEALLQGHTGNYEGRHLFSQEHGTIDWQVGQKVLLSFLLMGAMLRWQTILSRPMHLLGSASFTIYFLHYYLLILFHWAWDWTRPPASGLLLAGVTALVLAGCCAIAILARRVLGPAWSRRLVGA